MSCGEPPTATVNRRAGTSGTCGRRSLDVPPSCKPTRGLRCTSRTSPAAVANSSRPPPHARLPPTRRASRPALHNKPASHELDPPRSLRARRHRDATLHLLVSRTARSSREVLEDDAVQAVQRASVERVRSCRRRDRASDARGRACEQRPGRQVWVVVAHATASCSSNSVLLFCSCLRCAPARFFRACSWYSGLSSHP